MRVLAIQHGPNAGPGIVGEHLERHGAAIDLVTISDRIDRAVHHAPLPDPTAYDLVLPLGAIWSVYDDEHIGSWIHRELELLRTAVAADVPVLGICFGGQALAAALGGTVEPAPRPELGWTSILTDAPELVPAGPWFAWHTDRFSMPKGATELARNASGTQAFRYGRSLGLQFHPEVDTATVEAWLHMLGDAAEDTLEPHGLTRAELVRACREHEDAARREAGRLVDAFLRVVASPAGQEDATRRDDR